MNLMICEMMDRQQDQVPDREIVLEVSASLRVIVWQASLRIVVPTALKQVKHHFNLTF